MDKITPEQEDILRHHPASPAAERIREERSKAAWAEREAEEQAKRAAAQDYIERLEQALMVFGINPQNSTIDLRDCAQAYAKGRADEQALLDKAHEQRDAAQTRADTLRAEINGILTKLGVSPVEGPEMRAKGIAQVCDEAHALRLIAEHLGLSKLDPDAVRRRVQSDAVDLKVARERVAKVESLLGEECARGDNARHALSILGIIGDDLIGQAKLHVQHDAERNENSARRAKELEAARSATQTYASAEITANNRAVKAEARVKELEDELLKVRAAKCLDAMDASAGMVVTPNADPARDYNAEIVAARIDALKMLGVNPYDPPVCIAGAAKKRAKTLEHTDKLESDVIAVWDLWGAGREVKPGALHELCQKQERLTTHLRTEIGAVTEHLNNAGIPTHYGHDQKGNPVPFVERAALLAEAYKDAVWMQNKWHDGVMNAAAENDDAHDVLNDLGAPRRAGDLALGLAARIRSIPGLPRP